MATLKTILKFDGSEFSKGIKNAQKSMKNFHRDVGKPVIDIAKSIGKMALAAGAAAAALSTLALTRLSGLADEIDKASIRMGIGSDEVQRYKHAAELSGASLENFEKAILNTNKAILGAREGNKDYVDTLSSIGLELSDFEGMKPNEAFEKILKATDAMKDPVIRATAAVKLLGKTGAMLLPMAAGLEAMKKDADRVGFLDENMVKQGAEFGDNILRLKKSFDSLLASIFGFDTLNKYLDALVTHLANLRNSQAFQDFAKRVKEKAIEIIEDIYGIGVAIWNFVNDSNATFEVMVTALKVVASAFTLLLAVSIINSAVLMIGKIKALSIAVYGLSKSFIVFAGTVLAPIALVTAALYGIGVLIGGLIVMMTEKVSFGDALNLVFEESLVVLDRWGKKAKDTFSKVIPQSVKDSKKEIDKLISDLKDHEKFKLPTMPNVPTLIPDLPELDTEIKDSVADGVIEGIEKSKNSWGRLFTRTGDPGFSEMQRTLGTKDSSILSRIERLLVLQPQEIARQNTWAQNAGVVGGGF
jgi:hypothetical protein